MELVFKDNGNIVTTSLLVAEKFGKNHRDVLSAIDEIIKGVAEKSADLFEESFYTHSQNKQNYRMFIMNQDGFSLLVMGFTGAKALEFKLDYIHAFNEMRNSLKNSIENLTKSDLARMILESEEDKKRLQIQNAKLQNRSDVYDKVFNADKYLSGSQVCKILELGYGNQTLYKKLREIGVFFKSKNEPMQQYSNKNWITLKEKWIKGLDAPVLTPYFAQSFIPHLAIKLGAVSNNLHKIQIQ